MRTLVTARWFSPGRFPDTDALVGRLLDENASTWLQEDLERDPERWPLQRLDEVRRPTLVLLAEHDVPEMGEVGRVLAEGIEGARLQTIPGSDHFVNIRNPEAFDRAVIGFLAQALT